MTAPAYPTQAEIEAAISVLTMAGYQIGAPKGGPRAVVKVHAPVMGAVPQVKSHKGWESSYVLVTFADGETCGAYATREKDKGGWYLGAAVRSAATRYRDRRTPEMGDVDAEMHHARKVAVPDVLEIYCDDVRLDADIAAVNAATAEYRSGKMAYGVRGY